MLIFFTNGSLMEFLFRYFVSFCLLSLKMVWSSSGWNVFKRISDKYWSSSRFHSWSYTNYTFMTFLMMLSVILVYMLMTLLFTLSVIRHLICSNNYNWLLNLILIYKTCGPRQEVAHLLQCWKSSTCFI